jgi:hypothetical protein
MFVFIAHAEADQAAAEDLKAFLKSRGLVVETETGAKGFRHLQPSDVVIALWSQKSVFGAHRMMMERRMLDAWADGRLVLVKLDHGFLPVGLRDLPAIDASFETGRQLSVWPHVERAAREAMNRALSEQHHKIGGAPGRLDSTYGDMSKAMREPSTSAPRRIEISDGEVAAKAGKGGSLLLVVLIVVAVAALGWAGWQAFLRPETSVTLTYIAYGVAGLGLLLLLVVIALAARPLLKAQKAAAAPARAAAAAAAAPTAAVFISYSHADNAAVTPVVDAVKANGREVWIDRSGIQTGDGWAGEIVRAIRAAGGIMVMCSKHAFESDHVKREIYLADRYKKPMAPVFLEAAQPPEDFEYFFAGVQWLELYKLPEGERTAAIRRTLATV